MSGALNAGASGGAVFGFVGGGGVGGIAGSGAGALAYTGAPLWEEIALGVFLIGLGVSLVTWLQKRHSGSSFTAVPSTETG